MARTPSTEDVYEGDGTTSVFQFHFPYLAASDVFVSVDGVDVSFTLLPGSVAQVQTTVPPAVGTVVKVYRNTEAIVPEHLFASGVPFLPRYVDENNRQLLYVSQEAINDTAVTAAEALVVAEEAKQIAQEAEDKIDGAIIDSSFQLRLDLAEPDGYTLVSGGALDFATSKIAGFVTSEARSLAAYFSNSVRIDLLMGLVPNNPAVDNGPTLNMILATAAGQRIPLDGFGAVFYTRTPVLPQSHQRLRRCTIISMGADTGAGVPRSHVPVVHANGVLSEKTNMLFEEVIVDGARSNWPNISMSTAGPEGGGSEDGGLHAWRLAGRITNSYWYRCAGINAGTAGWAIHNPTPGTSIDYQHRNLTFVDCVGTGNREHGMFADSFINIKWLGGALTGNGLDLNTTDPLEHGNRGARDSNGDLFGMPFDLEAYGPNFLGSMFTDFLMQSTDCRGNAIMGTIYNPIASNLAGYQSARNIRLIDCDLDSGLAITADRPPNTEGLSLNVVGNIVTVPPFNGLVIHCRHSGRPNINGFTKLDMSAGFIETVGAKAVISNGSYYDVSCPGLVHALTINPQPAVTITKTAGAAGAAFAKTLQATKAAAQCGIALRYSLSVTGATNAGGDLAADVTPPAGYLIDAIDISLLTGTIEPVRTAHAINGAGGSATVFVDTSNDTNLTGMLTVVLLPTA